jgi:hypothetical protein
VPSDLINLKKLAIQTQYCPDCDNELEFHVGVSVEAHPCHFLFGCAVCGEKEGVSMTPKYQVLFPLDGMDYKEKADYMHSLGKKFVTLKEFMMLRPKDQTKAIQYVIGLKQNKTALSAGADQDGNKST